MRREKGFTLIEAVISIFLFGVLVLIFSNLFVSHNAIFNYQKSLTDVSGSARRSMGDIVAYTAQAHRVLASQTVNGVAYSSGPTALVLQIPTVTPSGAYPSNTYDYVAFALDGNELTEQVQADSASMRQTGTKLLSDTVSSLAFTYNDPDFGNVKIVTADIITAENLKGQNITDELKQQILLRNY